MANRVYNVGEIINADGDAYRILGKITYRNNKDRMTWDEYRLAALQYNEERWLSVDNAYNEYSLSRKSSAPDTTGFHEVDSGVAQVIAKAGDVDVDIGDTVTFQEYEDHTEEYIISIENWDDGVEFSTGYYLDPWEFGREGEKVSRSSGGEVNPKTAVLIIAVMAIFWGLSVGIPGIAAFISSNKSISKYLKKSTDYQYVTSVTGEDKQKADVYSYSTALLDVQDKKEQLVKVAEGIIRGVNGNTESIQQNDEDKDYTVAILTNKEYCIIYHGEDDKIYIQVSSRKFAYTTDKQPYRSRRRTYRYFRRYYYSRGYNNDSYSYRKSRSSFGGYKDTPVFYDSNNSLNSYSGSVRQSSVGSRTSSGGGLSSGK